MSFATNDKGTSLSGARWGDQKLKTTLYVIQTAIPKPYGEQQSQKLQQIHTGKRKSNPSVTLKMVLKQEAGTKEEGKKKDLQKQTQDTQQNGNRNIYANNYIKCKGIKCSNQKTQAA